MKLTIPELSLVLLIGPSGSGKSTFARKHFRSTEILSSDFFRGIICDDENNQAVSKDAFELLHQACARRLAWRRFTVIDATNLLPDNRKTFLEMARRYHYLTAALVFDLPEDVCQHHNRQRPGRSVAPGVVTVHRKRLQQTLAGLCQEGYHLLHHFASREQVESAIIEREWMDFDRQNETGPFDIIGDVHGCFDELLMLLDRLGYTIAWQPDAEGRLEVVVTPPPGRKLIFVGDLVDRGPRVPAVLRLVMNLARAGVALVVQGNHDNKLRRKLQGNQVQLSHGLAESVAQLEQEKEDFREAVREFLETLPTHYLLDGGRLVIAHAGLRENLQGRASVRVRSFALFGDTTGGRDSFGLPIRRDWAAEYAGWATVVYGHTPVTEPRWVNRTINIDTGCVFGGRLTALRYPEKELCSVPALRVYCEAPRPFLGNGQPEAGNNTQEDESVSPAESSQQEHHS